MKPVYLNLAQWQEVNRCILQVAESLLVQSYESSYNKEEGKVLFNMSERKRQLAANILDQVAD